MFEYDTLRLNCRPLARQNFSRFAELTIDDSEIQKYFRKLSSFGEVMEYLTFLPLCNCLSVALSTKVSHSIVGHIVGYVGEYHELRIEFFVFSQFRRNHYMSEALRDYINFASMQGFGNFVFEIEESNLASAGLLEKLGATSSPSENFTSYAGEETHHFRVFRIFR